MPCGLGWKGLVQEVLHGEGAVWQRCSLGVMSNGSWMKHGNEVDAETICDSAHGVCCIPSSCWL